MSTVLHKTDQFGNPNGGQELIFFCPGCKCAHGVIVTHEPKWGWNESMEKPSFTPSILTTWTDFTEEGLAMLDRGEDPPNGKYPSREIRCHSYVTDGNIHFLDDCSHDLKGQIVPLSEF
jgi:hypothetical protein